MDAQPLKLDAAIEAREIARRAMERCSYLFDAPREEVEAAFAEELLKAFIEDAEGWLDYMRAAYVYGVEAIREAMAIQFCRDAEERAKQA